MNGRAVFVHAVRRVREVVQECLDANGLLADDIDLFIFHQANLRIVESMAESFKIPESRDAQQHPALRQHGRAPRCPSACTRPSWAGG